jgi:hypothetical protein
VTSNWQGKRTFAPVMLRRLAKLGIAKTDPSELAPEEVRVSSHTAEHYRKGVQGLCYGPCGMFTPRELALRPPLELPEGRPHPIQRRLWRVHARLTVGIWIC